jgi:membrane-bound lytic murein transglycosylase D
MIRVPEGRSEQIQQRLSGGEKLPAVNLTVRHLVRRNETLSGIAAEYSVSPGRLAAANGIGVHKPLRRGMMLTVPASMHAPAPEVIDVATDPRASTAYVPQRKIGLPAKLVGNSAAADRVNHIVRRGETLELVARTYGVTPGEIQLWNHMTGTALQPGQRLRVHTPEDAAMASAAVDSAQIAALKVPAARHHGRKHGSQAPVANSGSHVVVRKGQTLSQIAAQHGVSVSALRRANGMTGSSLRAGQKLRLPG